MLGRGIKIFGVWYGREIKRETSENITSWNWFLVFFSCEKKDYNNVKEGKKKTESVNTERRVEMEIVDAELVCEVY